MTEAANLQYPIGKPTRPETLSPEERDAAINTIAALPKQLAAAIEGLSEAQLDTPYRPGGWTIRQLVHHIADSHMNAYSRMRHALATGGVTSEEWPTIYGYDQAAWAEMPDSKLPAAVSLQLLDSLHQRWAATLRAVPEAEWASRGYRHSQDGPQPLPKVLALYAWHSDHHLAHIVNCRQRHCW